MTYDYSNVHVGMVSLGCPKNLVDGEAMLGLLRARGFSITPDADFADLIIVNTCGFIDIAKKESISAILDMAGKKKTGRCKALVVTGCLSERYGNLFKDELPEVDAVLGTGEYGRICEVIEGLAMGSGLVDGPGPDGSQNSPNSQNGEIFHIRSNRTVFESSCADRIGHLNAQRVLTNATGYVYIKIAEGCDNNCSYCVIPRIRGRYLSRGKSDIIAEAARLSEGRNQDIEAVLVAQDTTRYGGPASGPASGAGLGPASGAASGPASGAGLGPASGAGSEALCDLIDGLSQLERVRWIRILYGYPDRIDSFLLREFAGNKKLLHYLDLPIQHASDAVLRRMGRRYGRVELESAISELRRAAPDIVLRTTVMTGFPGEGEQDFEELLDFVSRVRFDRLGVFVFSPEEGTPAAEMGGRVLKKTARERRSQLLKLQAGIMMQTESARIGRVYEAMLDAGPLPAGPGRVRYLARTYAEAPEIDGHIRILAGVGHSGRVASLKQGGFVNIKITGIDSKGLFGEFVT